MKKGFMPLALLSLWIAGCAHGTPPRGWSVTGSTPDHYEVGTQPGNLHSGDVNAYIRSTRPGKGFGTLMQTINADGYRNQRIRLTGHLKTENADWAGLWMRIDGANRRIAGFDNMEDRGPRGNTDWRSYSIVLDVPSDSLDIAFGFLLHGQGEVLADDFKLEAVGKDVPLTGSAPPSLPTQPANMSFSP
ncbi:hypothetical protein [Dyella mobilis]|uniref:Transcriptional regulator n=1 Tax=Dyella mobilis TaxID=1849582 RepID=A0ABS2KI55_9GAMM|nr:hypothetical protein [Dyella mobilis]MBM7130603.1 hypothetical protein [Dyella mobilis]GLQ97230.1 hypothetical protein GCM10007863_16500 [Dyella mobilis]